MPFKSKGPWRSALNAVHGKASREYDPTELKVYLADISPISPLYLPCISPISPLYLPCISPISRLYLPYISQVYLVEFTSVLGGPLDVLRGLRRLLFWQASPLHLPRISPTSPPHLPRICPASAPHLPSISLYLLLFWQVSVPP